MIKNIKLIQNHKFLQIKWRQKGQK